MLTPRYTVYGLEGHTGLDMKMLNLNDHNSAETPSQIRIGYLPLIPCSDSNTTAIEKNQTLYESEFF